MTRFSVALLLAATVCPAAEPDAAKLAAAHRKDRAVEPLDETTVVAEAEEFRTQGDGWKARNWGENYYAATFANSFLSRKAFLGAPEKGPKSAASIVVTVPKAGKYLALVRYEACYRFETQFKLVVEQAGKTKLDRLFGARANPKIWAFRERVKPEVSWPWGAVENVVWEGHDAFVELDAGAATLTLVADDQPEPAAKRNVDLVMLTSDEAGVKTRIDKENYLPLDGLLTQAGDLFVKLHNHADGPDMTLTVAQGTEHSPYWVHLRSWKPKAISAEPGQSSEWVEVGSLLDSLNDGQWTLNAAKGIAANPKAMKKGKAAPKAVGKDQALRYSVEFGVPGPDGKIESIRRFDDLTGALPLAYDANTRWTRRVRHIDEVLYDLLAYLKQQPIRGTPPQRTLIFGYGFDARAGDAKYSAAVDEFLKLVGTTAISGSGRSDAPPDGMVRGYIDVRGVPTHQLEAHCAKLKADGKADRIAVVSLGDEIGLGGPPANDHANFRTWLKTQGVKPSDLDPAAGDDFEKLMYLPKPDPAKAGLSYWSKIYAYRVGIKQLKDRTDILRRNLPNAGIGANFSPHASSLYLGETHHWISLFREDGMTMPWGEDYIWQVPVGSQQMGLLMLDMYRAGIAGKPDRKIHFYVMPHTPGNTVNSWRRMFYGSVAHGAKVLNLFEFRPVQVAYTENHTSDPAMFQAVRVGLHELGTFEDIVQDGQVRPARAGLWFSEAADVWHDNRAPFDAAKRSLYLALRHQQLPLDMVVEGDDLSRLQTLVLTDRHVSRKAGKAIADWVAAGGKLVATAGAGMLDELDKPNTVLRELLGVDETGLKESTSVIRFEKQDLPFAEPVGNLILVDNGKKFPWPVYGLRAVVKAAAGAEVVIAFDDGSPALTRRTVGKGKATYAAYLPGLTYLKPAIPKRPVDRGSTDDSMAHHLPHGWHPDFHAMIGWLVDADVPVNCSNQLVETTILESPNGVAIPLVNWTPNAIAGLTVTVNIPVPTGKVSLASGKPVKMEMKDGKPVFTLDIDVADALILRK